MSLLDFIKDFVSIVALVSGCVSIFQYLKIKPMTLVQAAKSKVGIIFILSLIITILLFAIPWNKINFNGDVKPITKVVHDTVILKTVVENSSITQAIKKPTQQKIKRGVIKKHEESATKTDSTKTNIVQQTTQNNGQQNQNNGTNSGNIGGNGNHNFDGGNGNQYNAPIINGNINYNQEKTLPEQSLYSIYSLLNHVITDNKNFSADRVDVITESNCNYPKIPDQIIEYLKSKGFDPQSGFGVTSPAIKGIKWDTIRVNRMIRDKSKKRIAISVGRFD